MPLGARPGRSLAPPAAEPSGGADSGGAMRWRNVVGIGWSSLRRRARRKVTAGPDAHPEPVTGRRATGTPARPEATGLLPRPTPSPAQGLRRVADDPPRRGRPDRAYTTRVSSTTWCPAGSSRCRRPGEPSGWRHRLGDYDGGPVISCTVPSWSEERQADAVFQPAETHRRGAMALLTADTTGWEPGFRAPPADHLGLGVPGPLPSYPTPSGPGDRGRVPVTTRPTTSGAATASTTDRPATGAAGR
jgi:hypothetical protein